MAEKIREVAEKAIGTSGAGLKDVLVELLDAIKGAEVSDYIKVLKESPDLLMKGIPKVGEGSAQSEGCHFTDKRFYACDIRQGKRIWHREICE